MYVRRVLFVMMMSRSCAFLVQKKRLLHRLPAVVVPSIKEAMMGQHRHPSSTRRWMASVTGPVYTSDDPQAPQITLFTKEGCTLCDRVKDILVSVREEYPHSLDQKDIEDNDKTEWFNRYKFDIPVLHMNGQYWIKHRITREEAMQGIEAARDGRFESPPGEPDAAKWEKIY